MALSSLRLSKAGTFALVLFACGGSDDGGAAAPGPDVPSDPVVTPETDPPADLTVRVSPNRRIGFSTGAPVDVPPDSPWIVGGAAFARVGEETKAFPGTVDDKGELVIPDVPAGPYVLEVRYRPDVANDPPRVARYPVDGARSVRLGANYWMRPGTKPFDDQTSKVALTLDVPAGFVAGDLFEWIGLRSYFFRDMTYTPPIDEVVNEAEENVPDEGATSSNAWTIAGSALFQAYGLEASGLPQAAEGDDLTIYQTRRSPDRREGDRFTPWTVVNRTEVIGMYKVPNPSFSSGTTNLVTGALVAPPRVPTAISFQGTSFAALRDVAGYPKTATSSASITLFNEAGEGPEIFSSVAPVAWSLSARSIGVPVDLTCFPVPDSGMCVPQSCAVGCANAIDGYTDPGDLTYSFDAPDIGGGLRAIYNAGYSFSYPWVDPETGGRASLSANSVTIQRKTSGAVSFTLELGAVTSISVGGRKPSFDELVEIPAAEARNITFAAPAFGTPHHYEVTIIELLPDRGIEDATRQTRTAGSVATKTTTAEVAEGVFRSGHTYYLRVEASTNPIDYAAPAVRPVTNYSRTAVFTAPFKIP